MWIGYLEINCNRHFIIKVVWPNNVNEKRFGILNSCKQVFLPGNDLRLSTGWHCFRVLFYLKKKRFHLFSWLTLWLFLDKFVTVLLQVFALHIPFGASSSMSYFSNYKTQKLVFILLRFNNNNKMAFLHLAI